IVSFSSFSALSFLLLFFSPPPPPPTSPLFPYTTLFRSLLGRRLGQLHRFGIAPVGIRLLSLRKGVGARRPRQQNHPQTEPVKLRSEEHTSELQSRSDLVCRLLLEKKKKKNKKKTTNKYK